MFLITSGAVNDGGLCHVVPGSANFSYELKEDWRTLWDPVIRPTDVLELGYFSLFARLNNKQLIEERRLLGMALDRTFHKTSDNLKKLLDIFRTGSLISTDYNNNSPIKQN